MVPTKAVRRGSGLSLSVLGKNKQTNKKTPQSGANSMIANCHINDVI